MSIRFCFKLALTNLSKNKRLYFPYMITAAGMIAMFYIMQYLYKSKALEGSGSISHLRDMLGFAGIVTAIFVTIFLFYTNSFVIKQRSREFGLYGILGLEKRHVGKIMLAEASVLFAVCLLSGIAAGILFSKAMFLLLLKLLSVDVRFGFEVSGYGVAAAAVLFAAIFALTFIWNLFQIHLSQPIQLLNAGKTGEREPRVKWLVALTGLICLGGGYAIAQTNADPREVIFLFFIAVVLVIAGTYQLFTAGSIALLKLMRKNKGYYYQTQRFISISGMIYRMKQNAAGLASICILSTAVLVTLSTTVSMYAGMEDILRTRFPRNIYVQASDTTAAQAKELDGIIENRLQGMGIEAENTLRYCYRFFLASRGDDGGFHSSGETYSQNRNVVWPDYISLTCIPFSEYNRIQGAGGALEPDEVLLHNSREQYGGEVLNVGNLSFEIKGRIDGLGVGDDFMSRSMENLYVVVPDDAIGKIAAALGEDEISGGALTYSHSFDLNADAAEQIELFNSLNSDFKQTGYNIYSECAEASRESMLSLYGGFLFLGLFLGSLFILATVLIIYYKQVSEGQNDRDRFSIMQKVGLTKDEVRSAIRSQVLSVFYLPLVMSVIHIAAGFKVVTKLLAILNLTNAWLFFICVLVLVLLFACFYTAIYTVTARVYYRIVKEQV